ncbi:RagB/SusD family nutrient uptake outer membrane protein [Segetibacter koreensis]|uniref:RagB/SusD family nutrient uptake outer membrane protein n=1 Tax=Segetibacter koreensis TaxID=398037 RepID=UPI00036FD28C|nr:RagB/SusD family nutrient uptake outer membrane protein [Segetibacter koreensis]
MKPLLKIYISIFIVLVSVGCKKELLNTIPNDRITSDIFWTQEKDAVTACNALYTFLDGTNQLQRDVFSDVAHTNNEYGDYKAIETGAYNAISPVVQAEWTNDYKGIHGANYFLENIGKVASIDTGLITHLTGEVRFLRAYFYTNLVFIYGDVPLITKSLSIDEAKNVVRTPASEIVDFIYNELNEAANELPVNATEKGRITKGAALALNARTMLYAKRFDKAAELAKAVIDLGVYSLYPSYKQLFSYAAENNSEVVLDKEFLKNVYANNVMELFAPFSILSNGVTVVPLKKIADNYQMTNGKGINETGSGFDPYNPYKNRDPRLKYSIYVPGDTLPTGAIFDSRPNSGTADAVGSNYQVSVTGFYVKKYINSEDITDLGNCGINIILMRYAEVLLTYAEAKIELGQIDGSVYDAINAVRQRPDVNMPSISEAQTQAELRETVRHERMVELAFEGQRFFDIRRWGIADQVFTVPVAGITYVKNGQLTTVVQPGFVRSFQKRDYLWPIPQKELDLNRDLKQNEGW